MSTNPSLQSRFRAAAIFHSLTPEVRAALIHTAEAEKQLAAMEARREPDTSPTDTGAVEVRHFFEQPGDKNYAELVAKAGAEIDAEVIAERNATIADLEQRLAEARRAADKRELAALRERDAALASLEKAEKRIGELETGVAKITRALDESVSMNRCAFRNIAAALSPDAGEDR